MPIYTDPTGRKVFYVPSSDRQIKVSDKVAPYWETPGYKEYSEHPEEALAAAHQKAMKKMASLSLALDPTKKQPGT